jgi:hypothetical protein
LIFSKKGTAKVSQGNERSVCVVRPEWLFHSIYHWKRQEESLYLLEETVKEEDQVIPMDISVKFGKDDWAELNDEVDQALLEETSDEEKDDWSDLDNLLEDLEQPLKRHKADKD